jgi:hypothetical protein
VHFLHRYLEDPPLLASGEIENLTGLGIDADASAGTHKFLVIEEITQKTTVSLLVDLHLPIEREQHGHVEMIADGLQIALHDGLLRIDGYVSGVAT